MKLLTKFAHAPVSEELTEGEETFRKLVEALPDSILVHSDNKIVFLNPSCLRLLGAQRPEQFLGKDVFEIIHPDYRQAIKSRIQNNYQTGTASAPMESALLTIGGSAIPIEAAAIPITWKGRPAMEVIARDIRQRKRTEETLREYEKVVEGLEEMICVVDREYRYVLANRAFLNYRGTQRDQVVGYLVSELLPFSVFDRVVKEKLDECFRGNIVSYELTYDYPNLGPRDLFISYYPIEGPEGIDRAACILRDVTERNQAERANREWQKRVELAEKAGLRIGLWDWDLNANRVIWSDETHRQWGYARETFSGRVEDAVTRIHPEDRCRVEEAIRSALAGNSEYTAQYRVVHPDGNTCWIDAHGVAVREGPIHMLGISIDITDVKKTEQSLQSAKIELGRVNRILTMGELTASIAHEINQPLAAIVTNMGASLRLLAMQPPNLEEAREAMAESIREAMRSSQVIARVRALLNKEPPQMRPLTLNAIIREVLALCATDLIRAGVTVHTELASGLPEVPGDPIQLQQVMLNLIMNGIDAMSEVTNRPRGLFIKSAEHPSWSRFRIPAWDWTRIKPTEFSNHSLRPSPKESEWDCRSAVPSSKLTGAVCGPHLGQCKGRFFNSTCQRQTPQRSEPPSVVFVVDDDAPIRDVSAGKSGLDFQRKLAQAEYSHSDHFHHWPRRYSRAGSG